MQMIARDAAVIGHKSPMPRIEIGADERAQAGIAARPIRSILEMLEIDRVWALIVEASR